MAAGDLSALEQAAELRRGRHGRRGGLGSEREPAVRGLPVGSAPCSGGLSHRCAVSGVGGLGESLEGRYQLGADFVAAGPAREHRFRQGRARRSGVQPTYRRSGPCEQRRARSRGQGLRPFGLAAPFSEILHVDPDEQIAALPRACARLRGCTARQRIEAGSGGVPAGPARACRDVAAAAAVGLASTAHGLTSRPEAMPPTLLRGCDTARSNVTRRPRVGLLLAMIDAAATAQWRRQKLLPAPLGADVVAGFEALPVMCRGPAAC